jgi:hypothetical protein
MTCRAIALFDFVGNEEAEELSFKAGDMLHVTQSDLGDGWWEGRTASGQLGVFPELYVQLLEVCSRTLVVLHGVVF